VVAVAAVGLSCLSFLFLIFHYFCVQCMVGLATVKKLARSIKFNLESHFYEAL
jgi:hypothetical protein